MKKTGVFLLFALFWLNPLPAIDFAGVLWADYYAYIDPCSNARVRLTVAPKLKWKNESGTFDVHLSGIGFIQAIDEPLLIEPERIIREAYLGLHLGIIDINVGQKFVNWGMVDFLSPLNVVNHSDTSVLSVDNFLEGSLPDLLAQVRVYPTDSFSFEMVYAPFLHHNLYDIDPIHVVLNENVFGTIYDVNAWFINREVPLFLELAHSIFTAFNYTSYLFDLTVSYSYYVDKSPDFDLSNVIETVIPGPIHEVRGTAYPSYNRVHNIALGCSFYLGEYLINADTAAKITGDWKGSDIGIKNSELFTAIQVERMFWNRVRVHLNLYHRKVFNYNAPIESPYSPLIASNIIAIIDDYLLQEARAQFYLLAHLDTHFFREKLLLGATFFNGNKEKAWYLVPRIAYKLSDRITVSAGADIIWTKYDEEETFLGKNEDIDNLYVRIQYAW